MKLKNKIDFERFDSAGNDLVKMAYKDNPFLDYVTGRIIKNSKNDVETNNYR